MKRWENQEDQTMKWMPGAKETIALAEKLNVYKQNPVKPYSLLNALRDVGKAMIGKYEDPFSLYDVVLDCLKNSFAGEEKRFRSALKLIYKKDLIDEPLYTEVLEALDAMKFVGGTMATLDEVTNLLKKSDNDSI